MGEIASHVDYSKVAIGNIEIRITPIVWHADAGSFPAESKS